MGKICSLYMKREKKAIRRSEFSSLREFYTFKNQFFITYIIFADGRNFKCEKKFCKTFDLFEFQKGSSNKIFQLTITLAVFVEINY